MRISAVEKKILNIIQQDIPLSPYPFKILARKVGISEKRFLCMLETLKGNGIVRGYAAHLNHRALGFKSTLLGLRVAGKDIKELAEDIIAHPEVTHCFEREGEHNLWVVVIYKNGELGKLTSHISKKIGKDNILNLRTLKKFKLKTLINV